MAFGLTSSGFVAKRLADIKEEIETSLKSELGAGINLESSSPLGQMVGILSEREALIWELAEAVYNSQYPDSAEGTSLDNVVSLNNLTRLPETKSTVEGRVFGTLATVVPLGFIASVAGDSTARFVSIETDSIGAGIDEVQTITFDLVPDSGSFKLTYESETTAAIDWNDTNTDVQNALNALSGLSAVTVTGDFNAGFVVTFAGADGQQDQPLLGTVDNTLLQGATPVVITVTETTKGFLPFADIDFEAESAGATAAPADSLTVIETPTSGIDSITNLLDAEVGNAVETDTELKIRRAEQLRRAGSATIEGIRNNVLEVTDVVQALVIENASDLVDSDGRPPHSFETVVDGGDNQEIADAIFEAKPAGIQTDGDITENVTDSQGFIYDVKFSRPAEIDIWMIVDITPNTDPAEGDIYPANGDDLVKAAIIEFGDDFDIGQDVVVNLLYTPINTVPGVIGITIKIGLAPAPTQSDNIPIDSDEIAKFDTSRITVNS